MANRLLLVVLRLDVRVFWGGGLLKVTVLYCRLWLLSASAYTLGHNVLCA